MLAFSQVYTLRGLRCRVDCTSAHPRADSRTTRLHAQTVLILGDNDKSARRPRVSIVLPCSIKDVERYSIDHSFEKPTG